MLRIASKHGMDNHLACYSDKPMQPEMNKDGATEKQIEAWKNWKVRDDIMSFVLFQNITSSCRIGIRYMPTALDLWITLAGLYGSSDNPSNKYWRVVNFTDLKYENYDSIEDFIADFESIQSELDDIGISLPEEWYSSSFIYLLSKAFPRWATSKVEDILTSRRFPTTEMLMFDIQSQSKMRRQSCADKKSST